MHATEWGTADKVPQANSGGMEKLLYRVHEAGDVLGLSRSKVYMLIRAGELPSVRIDGARRIKAVDLHTYVAGLGRAA